VKEKIGKEHIFEEEISKTYRMKKISAPNIKEGSVIELSYEITSDLFSYLREWEFQTEIPTRWSEYSLEYPEYFSFSQSAQGFEQYVINEQSEGTGNANWTESERSEGRVAQSTTTNNSVNFSTRKYHWAIQNAPALRPEPFIDNPQSYATKIEFQLQYLQFPNSQRQTFSGSWNTMSEELLKDPEFGKQLERKKFVQEALPQLITAEQSEQEKMIAIADHLTRMVKWNGGSSIYPSQSLEKVYKEGVGNVADMNFLLIAFLREAGFEAHPVVGSTRANGFVNPSNPVMYKLNYLSALVKSGDKEFVMDISDSSLPFGFLPINGMNFRG
jgi:transglutaminase-like putative cysteine protease